LPFTEGTITKLVVDIYECDRCGKRAKVERDPESAPQVPKGWELVRHPDLTGDTMLIFDRRDCMGVWFSTWVRVRYGGPEELPPRKRRKQPKGE